jgi:hypothetical protein
MTTQPTLTQAIAATRRVFPNATESEVRATATGIHAHLVAMEAATYTVITGDEVTTGHTFDEATCMADDYIFHHDGKRPVTVTDAVTGDVIVCCTGITCPDCEGIADAVAHHAEYVAGWGGHVSDAIEYRCRGCGEVWTAA